MPLVSAPEQVSHSVLLLVVPVLPVTAYLLQTVAVISPVSAAVFAVVFVVPSFVRLAVVSL